MNREAIQKVRDHIAALDAANFDMNRWHTENGHCGTCACIGGWAESLLFGDVSLSRSENTVGAMLGLDEGQTRGLFYPPYKGPGSCGWRAEPGQAVRVLDHLLETGKVDWSVIDQPEAQANG